MTSRPITVWHVITGLDAAGAEFNLLRLLSAMDGAEFIPTVVSLQPAGPVKPLIEDLGISVHSVNISDPLDIVGGVKNLRRLFRAARPSLVQTWMDHADFLGGIIARVTGVRRVVWGIQNTEIDPASDNTSRLISRLNTKLSSRVPMKIVANSVRGAETHVRMGYPPEKIRVIHSGFEVADPDGEAVAAVRQSWEVNDRQIVVGRVARFAAVKDYPTFISAAGKLAKTHDDVVFVMCGQGMERTNHALMSMLDEAGIQERVRLLGPQRDIMRVHAAFDVEVSSSRSEGFPGVVAEAMSVGTPAVVTNAGDSALLVADTGFVVPVQDDEGIVKALSTLAKKGRDGCAELGKAAQKRIDEHYSLNQMADSYSSLYREMMRAD